MIKEIDFDLLPDDNDECRNECDDICGGFVPVLPTEYGESLSYYEALCKLSKKVDEFETGQVESVNGKTGVVVLTAEDVGALPVGTPVGEVNSVNGKTGDVVLTAEDVGALPVGTPVGDVDSVNGQTGDVVLTAEDVGAIPVSEKGANNGVATIDSDGYVVQPVRGGTGGAVDSVNGKTGVVVLTAEDVGALPVGTPVGEVNSVNGKTGDVVLTAEDVGALPVGTPVGDVDSVNGKTGVVVLTAEDVGAIPVGTEVGAVDSVNGQTGDVVLTAADVGAANVTHASTHAVGGSDPVTPDSINAVNKAGDIMGGNLEITLQDENPTLTLTREGVSKTVVKTGSSGNSYFENVTGDNNYDDIVIRNRQTPLTNRFQIYSTNDGTTKNYNFFGEHNKPSGTYTGNGSATSRTINTGSIGNGLLIRSGQGSCLVLLSGAICIQNKTVTTYSYSEIHYENGVLTIASTGDHFNKNGITYAYQCL